MAGVDATAAWEAAVARAAVYELCWRGLAFPRPEHLERIDAITSLLRGIDTGADSVQHAITAAIDARRGSLAELRRAHGQLFTQIDSQDCPPYETAFSAEDVYRQSQVMADVAGFYRAHGLAVGGVERERPDHIETELEFMTFMARKEAWALESFGAEEVDECRHTQDRFLAEHLGCWGPAFGARAQAVAPGAFHAAVGRLLHEWLRYDMAASGVEPRDVFDDPQPLPAPPEPDGGSCGADASVQCASGGGCPLADPFDVVGPGSGGES